ncbi:MAG: hypothetical protein ACO1SV_03550 [Fimbriimonas sp.]
MLLGTKGHACKTMEAAEAYLREFIIETLKDPTGPMQRHSMEYDLYLPWLHEDVWSSPSPDGGNGRLADLDRLYMDAAWSLVQQGYLRPGPRKISSHVRPTDYGKGYSLTYKGMRWIEEEV